MIDIMEKFYPILEPKASTIDKILSFSKSVKSLKLILLEDKIILNLN